MAKKDKPKKIDKLTPEQEAQLPNYRDKWISIGRDTSPSDRPRAEAAIKSIYKQERLKEPVIIWCQSPLGVVMCRGIFILHQELEDKKLKGFPSKEKADRWAEDLSRAHIENVWHQAREAARPQLGDFVDQAYLERSSLNNSMLGFVYGQHDANWLAFYEYFHDVVGLKDATSGLAGLWELSKSTGWIFPCQDVCFASERHNILKFDDLDRAHSDDGPAIGFPDGWGTYMINGVRVPRYVVMEPEKITVERIRSESNEEIRRIMIERFGWDRLMDEEGAKMTDADLEPSGADGFRALMEMKDGSKVLVCCCASTGRTYHLQVPPSTRTCKGAAEWLAQENDLNLLVRT